MAGSWGHMTNDDGTPYNERYGLGSMLETGGDTFETLDECYGMIWWLVKELAEARLPLEVRQTRGDLLDLIREAQVNYQEGREIGKDPSKPANLHAIHDRGDAREYLAEADYALARPAEGFTEEVP